MKKDDTYRSQFRLPYGLFEKLKAESEKNHRSLNAEIVARLEESLGQPASTATMEPPTVHDHLYQETVDSHLREIAKEMSASFSQQAAREIEETLRKQREEYYEENFAKRHVEELYGRDFLPYILRAIESTQTDMQELNATLQRYMQDMKDADADANSDQT